MGFDDILPLIGSFGRYQLGIYIALSYVNVMCGLLILSNVFFQAKPNHRCRLPYENDTSIYLLSEETLKENFPIDPASQTYSKCYMFDDNKNNVACSDYVFDTSIYTRTTIVEWNMVCSRAFMGASADSSFMVGVMIGSLVLGQLSDRYGRKKILCGNIIAQVVVGMLTTVNQYYAAFVIARMLMGACVSGGMLTAYVLGTEMVGPSDRIYTGTMFHFFFALGYMLVALYAYFIRDWRYLIGSITATGIVFFGYWFIIPESPRWLLAHNKIYKAEKLIKRMAKVNRKDLSEEQLNDFIGDHKTNNDAQEGDNKPAKKASVFDICRYPKLRRRSLIIFLDWFVIALSYYGLSWNTSNLGGNDFLNLFIAGLVEIPAYIILLLTLNRWGRKILLCGYMICAALFLISIAAVPQDMDWLIVTLVMIGKFAVTGSSSVIYIFTVEQYPTVIRNAGLGAASTVARCGTILAPFINTASEYWRPIPMLVYGVLILIGAGLSLTLPETLHKKLPETLEEGENF